MSPAFRVLSPGVLTTVQDLGRPGYQHLGVSVGGALDPIALQASNALVGNAPDTCALEIACLGPALVLETDSAHVAFAGAHAAIEILPDEDAATGAKITPQRSVRLQHGETVRIGAVPQGNVVYMAVEGGFAIDPVLGSRATTVRGAMGGWQGRALHASDRVPIVRDKASDRGEHNLIGFDFARPERLRVMLGPQHDCFSEAEIEKFFAGEYTVAAESDRMGLRLAGPPIQGTVSNIVSDAVAPGSIQIPGSGAPILLLAERQTTGGYPKLATVISADLPAAGRLRPGAKISFERVTREEAVEARRAMMRQIANLPNHCVPMMPLDSMLLTMNLISGATDGTGLEA